MKMFVFPHSGGFGYQYNFFRNYNFRDISEFYTYDYPRHLRENDSKSIEKNFSDRVNNAVSKLLEYGIKSGEYVLFGHSLGALVAYESGIKLQRDYGLSPATIVMSSQNPPVCFGKVKSWLTSMDLESTLIKLGGMNSDLTKERDAVKFYKRLLYEDLAIIDTYEPTIPSQNEMPKKMLIFYADSDPVLDTSLLNQWSRCALEYKIFKYSGNHFYIYSNAESVMKQIDENVRLER